MDAHVNPISIFLPVLVIVALTVIAFLRMATARARVAKEGSVSVDFYRTYQGGTEPDYAVVAVRHYGNLLELPVLFYAGSLTAFAIGAVTPWVLLWAWGFVVFRLIQSAIHLTVNAPMYRGLAFSLSWLFMIALWVTLAWAICAQL